MTNSIKNVLVTGGAGYVGAVLVPKLIRHGYRVTVLDWFIYGKVFENIKDKRFLLEVKGDLKDKRLLSRYLSNTDAVIHLACISNDPSFELDAKFGKTVNYDNTIQLADLAVKFGVKRFIYASSSSVYGVKKEKEVTENLTLAPLTDYSKYKVLCEQYLLKKATRNFCVLILRPATVCGYSPRLRLDLTVNMLTLQSLVNKRMTIFGGSQLRPNIHIEDMADLYVKTLEYPNEKICGKVFNAGYQNYSVLETAGMIKKTLADNSIKIEILPTNDYRSYSISSQKIARELGFKPKYTVEDAVLDLKKAYLKGLIKNPMEDIKYYNVRMMKQRQKYL